MDFRNAQTFLDQQVRLIGSFLPNLLGALLILIIGWIVAKIVSGLVRGVLKRTDLDNKLARSTGGSGLGIESGIATAVFWLIMLFVLIGFFQTLSLSAISEPLDSLVSQILAFLPRLLGAAIMLAVAWLVATILKRVVTGLLGGMGIDRRLSGMISEGEQAPASKPSGAAASATASTVRETVPGAAGGRLSLAETMGEVVYWLVFLLFLPAILGTLELGGILAPVQQMMSEVFAFLPNIFAAGLILVVGWFVARIIRKIVTSLLAAAGVDGLGERAGLSGVLGGQTLSGILGMVVYVFILIPVVISALNALEIAAITQPATNMLNTLLAAIPNIFAAAMVLIIAYVVGKLVSGIVGNLLAGLGVNRLPARLGVGSGEAKVGQRSLSDVIGTLIMVAIMLFASIEAARLLGFGALSELLAQFIQLGGQIVFGLIIFGFGLYLANLAYHLLRDSDAVQGELLPQAARLSIMVLAGAMALRQMGLANEIVNLAFGLLLGAIAVAAAIAFGLGGREVAGRELQQWVQSAKQNTSISAPPPPPRPTTDSPPQPASSGRPQPPPGGPRPPLS